MSQQLSPNPVQSGQSVDRVFYDILKRVGSRGKYQFYCQILWCTISIMCGTLSYFIPFLFYQGGYQCPLDFKGSCKDYVCALPQSQRAQFIHFDQITRISHYRTYLCDEETQLNFIIALIFAGALIGSMMTALLLRFMRKRDIIIISMIFVIFGITLVLMDNSLALAAFGCFLIQSFTCSILQIILCSVSQMVDEQRMASSSIQLYICFGLGIAINGPLFYFLPWKIVLLIFLLLPSFISLIVLHFLVKETIFDMFASLSPLRIYEALLSIAAINQKIDHGLTIQEVESIKKKYEQNQMSKNKGIQLSILDIFKFPSVRKIVILGFTLQFIFHYLFGAPQIAISKYSLSIYLNIAFLGVSGVIGSLIFSYFLQGFPRKTIISVFSFIQGIVIAIILYFASCVEQCSEQTSMVQTGGLFFFRMLMTISYSGFYILIFEIYPTQIRSEALMVVNIAVGAADLVIPMIINLTNSLNISIIWTFFFGNVLVIGVIYFLPETLNNPAPDIILELSYDKAEKQSNVGKLL